MEQILKVFFAIRFSGELKTPALCLTHEEKGLNGAKGSIWAGFGCRCSSNLLDWMFSCFTPWWWCWVYPIKSGKMRGYNFYLRLVEKIYMVRELR